MYNIENHILKVTIAAKGAELQHIHHKEHNLEYLWSADPAYWAKKSPVLFPIVGTLKNNTFLYHNQPYHLSRHGFARDQTFEVTHQTADSITFTIESNTETIHVYPFLFQFSITYKLTYNTLAVTYTVYNKGEEKMYFSVGGHPAFKVPLTENTTYTDYTLKFNQPENAGRWPISKEGLIENTPLPLLNNTTELPLTKELFSKDALVFKHLNSTEVQLLSGKTPHGLTFSFSGFPYLGLWAAPNADFVCIEPWCGIADAVDATGILKEKEGIETAEPGATVEKTWQVQFF